MTAVQQQSPARQLAPLLIATGLSASDDSVFNTGASLLAAALTRSPIAVARPRIRPVAAARTTPQ
jgi:hypothetical protein